MVCGQEASKGELCSTLCSSLTLTEVSKPPGALRFLLLAGFPAKNFEERDN